MSDLTKALCQFCKEVGTIHKDARAQYGQFADLAGVLSTVIPALSKNGLAVTQTFEPSEGFEPVLVTTLRHVSGEVVESRLPMVINKGRNALHDFGASCTYLRRYALLSILCLVADVDTDGATDEPAASAPAKPTTKPAPKAAAKPASKPEPAAPAAAPEPQQQATGDPITEDERQLCVQLLKDMAAADRNKLIAAFKQRFNLAADALITQYITTRSHCDFIQQQLTA